MARRVVGQIGAVAFRWRARLALLLVLAVVGLLALDQTESQGAAARASSAPKTATEQELVFESLFDPPSAWQHVNDIVEYDGKLFFSLSPYVSWETGGDIVRYNPASGVSQKVYTVAEQGVDLMYVFNGKIYVPGPDATESWAFGNFYTYDGVSWQKRRTIPSAVHVFEMAYLNGMLYATAQCNDATHNQEQVLYSSTDDGATWTKDVDFGKPASVIPGGLTTFNNKVYVFGNDASAEKGYLFSSGDGSIWSSKDTMPWTTVIPRSYFMEFQGYLYMGTRLGMYRMDVSENAEKVEALGDKYIKDFAVFNGELYAAAFDGQVSDPAEVRIYSSPDGVNWTLRYTKPLDNCPGPVLAMWMGVSLKAYGDSLYLGVPFDARVYRGTLVEPPDTEPPSVTVISPNGEEKRKIRRNYNVIWTATDNLGVSSVDIYYSTDGGATFPNVIATAMPNEGTFLWTVPDRVSSMSLVKVVAHDAAANPGEDVSDASFEISEVIPGDANDDGYVTVLDVTQLENVILGLADEIPDVDANQSGAVDVLDITKVEQIISGS